MARPMSLPRNSIARCLRLSGARIDAQHLGDVRTCVPRPEADFDGFTRLHGVDAALSQHAPVEEAFAGPI
jgi:hypothetical protein